MAADDTRETEPLIEEYVGILQEFGPSSDEAAEFRQAHRDIPELDDLDAVYAGVHRDKLRFLVRCAIYAVMCLLCAGILAVVITWRDIVNDLLLDNKGSEVAIHRLGEQVDAPASTEPDAKLQGDETRDVEVVLDKPAERPTTDRSGCPRVPQTLGWRRVRPERNRPAKQVVLSTRRIVFGSKNRGASGGPP